MVRAWWMCSESEVGDQREERMRTPPQDVDIHKVAELTGVLYWKLDLSDCDAQLDKVRKERGYVSMDEIQVTPEKMQNYEEKLKIFYTEHLHDDEEIRFVLEGSGYFDVRTAVSDEWIRVLVEPGDLIVLPSGIYHRFTLDNKNYIRARRLFKADPVWTPVNRPADDHPARLSYLNSLAVA